MRSPSQVAEKREGKRKSGTFLLLNLWPFAAILMFLLLIFLSNYVPIDFHRPVVADLPKSSSAYQQTGARREDAIRITVHARWSRLSREDRHAVARVGAGRAKRNSRRELTRKFIFQLMLTRKISMSNEWWMNLAAQELPRFPF